MSADIPTYTFFFIVFGMGSFVAFLSYRYDMWQKRRQAKNNVAMPSERNSERLYRLEQHLWGVLLVAISFSLFWALK
jgi:hypothetical protein|tara:strand:- start:86 stop:316 length:231 start_codon:yes stop_codon:yes gene_type:complete